jgi:hypothetical protein
MLGLKFDDYKKWLLILFYFFFYLPFFPFQLSIS